MASAGELKVMSVKNNFLLRPEANNSRNLIHGNERLSFGAG